MFAAIVCNNREQKPVNADTDRQEGKEAGLQKMQEHRRPSIPWGLSPSGRPKAWKADPYQSHHPPLCHWISWRTAHESSATSVVVSRWLPPVIPNLKVALKKELDNKNSKPTERQGKTKKHTYWGKSPVNHTWRVVTRHAHSKEAAVLRNLAGVDRLKIHRYDGLFLRPRTIRHIQIAPGIINCHDLFPEDAFRWKSNLAISCNGVSTVEIYIYMWGRTREGGQALLKTPLRSVSTKDKGIEKVRASFIKLFFTESKSHPNRSASTEDDVGGILQARSPIFAVSPELPSLLPRSDSLPPLVSELQPHMFLLNRGGPEHQIESYTAVMGACVGVYI